MDNSVKNNLVTFQTTQGLELRAGLLRVARYEVVFDLSHPSEVLRVSEVLSGFKVVMGDRTLYSGRAVIRSLVNAGGNMICEATLNEESWLDVDFSPAMARNGKLREEFGAFIQEWQKLYRVVPEFKVIIADMQSFLMDLKLWLDQVELGIRSSPSEDRLQLEQLAARQIAEPVLPSVDALFEKFEAIAERVPDELKPAHQSYMRRQLHSLVLCAPFAYRAYLKPLGYAGDYQLVRMMARNGQEGGSLFAKIVNNWFLRQPPAAAHRNRITYMTRKLQLETMRLMRQGRDARIYSIGCGPCQEVQDFLTEHEFSSRASFTLLDFNEETLEYARTALEDVKNAHGRTTRFQFVRKSVQNILKESSRTIERPDKDQFDLIYCAGLFDYLSDAVCQRLTNILYDWLAPEGLLLVTNVAPSNPLRHGMEHLLDWHLIYRTGPELSKLRPRRADPDSVSVCSDETGVNVFLEARKPGHGR